MKKSGLKMRSPNSFLNSRGQNIKNITNIEPNRLSFIHKLNLIFYDGFHAEIDLNKR